MSRLKPTDAPKDESESAPLWIVSYADMISLLMAFFVMLLTMSTAQSGVLCNEGEGIFQRTLYGFRRSIQGFGVPGLFGTVDESLHFDKPKVYYPIRDTRDQGAARVIDAREEQLRQDFHKLEQRARTAEAQLRGRNPNFLVLPVTFAPGRSALNDSARQLLSGFLADVKGFGAVEGLDVYVVGLARAEPDLHQQWRLSALRAHTAAQFLRDGLPAGTSCRVFSWGAAAGGDWVKKDNPISPHSQLAIATIRRADVGP